VEGSVVTQLWGVLTTLIYGFCMSMAILWLVNLMVGLRVAPDEEREGLDITQHGESIE
jgi:Amt family ammonium transporter